MLVRFKSRHMLTLLIVLFTTMALSLAAAHAQDEKILVVGGAEFADSMDPARAYSPTPIITFQATYDTLVTFPAESADKFEPRLAKSWDISDDKLTYTFHLRDDVKFSDGTPMTADDVVFSFKRFQNIKGNPSFLTATMASVEATDATTVVFKLTGSDPAILAKIVAWPFSVVNSKVVKENGGTDAADADKTDQAEAWFASNSAGTGPYIMESYEKESQVVLVRNPNYWGTAPYFDRVILQNIPESSAQKVALEAGDIDIAMDITPDQVDAINAIDGLNVYTTGSLTVHFLNMNRDPAIGGPLADPKVEMAVRYAIDYAGFRKLAGPGAVTPAAMLPVGMFGAYGTDKALTRDLEKAKALLAEAGYPDGFETTLDYPTYTTEGLNIETLAQKIASDLAEVGIKVKLAPAEIGAFLDKSRAAKIAFGAIWWQPDYIDPDNYLYFLPGRNGGKRVNWLEEAAEPSLLELRDKALVETNPDERLKLFAAVQDYWQANGPYAAYLQGSIQIGEKDDIKGLFRHPQWLLDVAKLSRVE
jgi:peptide/nickel transport system substrate-binding protein